MTNVCTLSLLHLQSNIYNNLKQFVWKCSSGINNNCPSCIAKIRRETNWLHMLFASDLNMAIKWNSPSRSKAATYRYSSWHRVISDLGNMQQIQSFYTALADLRNIEALKKKKKSNSSCTEYVVCPVQPIPSWPAWIEARRLCCLINPSICGVSPFGYGAGFGQWSFTISGAKTCCKLCSVQLLWLSHKLV